MKIRKVIFTTALSALVCFGLCQQVQSATDTPDPGGSLPTSNTADGQGALGSLTTGLYNSAFGFLSVLSLSDANFDTGIGAGALLVDNGGENTAVGAGALFSNTTGSDNTAVGAFALFNSTTAGLNVAVGDSALVSFNGTTAFDGANTALGSIALSAETSGEENVAVGRRALESLVSGSNNVAVGWRAGDNYTGGETNNICIGSGTGGTAGESNAIRIGDSASSGGIDVINNSTLANVVTIGPGLSTQGITILTLLGFGNVSIGNGLQTTTGASTCNIGGIFNQTPPAGSHGVVVGPNNQLADATLSSRRFKKDIAPIDKMSEGILALRPVTFHWKTDNTNEPEFGLVAEEVAEVNLNWITRNPQGEISGVRYETIPILLLNEFLKEHKKVEEQQANIAELKSTVAQQQKGMEVLTAQLKEQAAQIQKVSAQLEVNKPASKVVVNKP